MKKSKAKGMPHRWNIEPADIKEDFLNDPDWKGEIGLFTPLNDLVLFTNQAGFHANTGQYLLRMGYPPAPQASSAFLMMLRKAA